MTHMANISSVMAKYSFNFELKAEQKEIIENLLAAQDILVVLPTSFGKSIIYTLPPLVLDEVCIHQGTSTIRAIPLKK